MEKAFETILRWLKIEVEFEVRSNNIIRVVIPPHYYNEILEAISENITLYSQLQKIGQDKLVIVRREYVDGFWGKCKLTISRTDEGTELEYVFMGYEAVVNGSVVLVDSVGSMMEIGD